MARLTTGLLGMKGPARIGSSTSTAGGANSVASTSDLKDVKKSGATAAAGAAGKAMPRAAAVSMSRLQGPPSGAAAAPAAPGSSTLRPIAGSVDGGAHAMDELGSLPALRGPSAAAGVTGGGVGVGGRARGLAGATSLQDVRNQDGTSKKLPASTSAQTLLQPAKSSSAVSGASTSVQSIASGTRKESTATSSRGLKPSTAEDVTTIGVFRPYLHRYEQSDIHVVKFSPENDYLAVGLGNGHVHVYSVKGNLVSKCTPPADVAKLVCAATTINFRPALPGSTNKNTILVGYPTGHVHTFHYLSGTYASSIDEGENQILAMDCDATRLATAGEDAKIRIYHDESGWKLKQTLSIGSSDRETGHSNRIFSVKFIPGNIWNLDTGLCESSIYGPHIAGEGVDINEGMQCITASYRKEEPLQLWTLNSTPDAEQKAARTIPWTIMKERPYTMLYSAQFCQLKFGKCVLAAGGGGVNEVKCFDLSSDRCIGAAVNLKGTAYTAAVSKNGKYVAFGGGDKTIFLVEIAKDMPGDLTY